MASFLNIPDLKLDRSSLHGQGVLAEGDVPNGTVLFRETPLHFLQSLPNRPNVVVCSNCYRFVGSVKFQVSILCRKKSREFFSDTNENSVPDEDFFSAVVPCDQNCGEIYCSSSCMKSHWYRVHQLLCTGKITEVR